SADRLEVGRGGQGATHGRGGGHHRGDQVGAPALALPTLEVAVGGGGRPLPRLQLVGIHAQTHRATGLAPFGTEVQEDLVQALLLGLQPHPRRTGHDHHPHVGVLLLPAHDVGEGAQILDPALVHEPMNTVSTGICFSGVPGTRSMYSRARSAETRALSSVKSSGAGTAPDSGSPWPGLVPQVTKGSSSSASMTTSASKVASSSERSVFQYSTASSHSSPVGAWGRPLTYSKVVSSGAIMPARAPASIDMLQMVIRPSMES